MTAAVFVDTNVFIYCIEEKEPKKQQRAREWREALWNSRRGRTSFQVLQEFYSQATRKWPSQRQEIRSEVLDLLTWDPVAVNGPTLREAWGTQDRYAVTGVRVSVISAGLGTQELPKAG